MNLQEEIRLLGIEERRYMEDMIRSYGGISYCDCKHCDECSKNQIKECYEIASGNCNSEFAELINYGGYNSEEEFWVNI